ncbi:MAG: hypothetical protein ACI4TZ_02720, partial [Christensenellales bacterium]
MDFLFKTIKTTFDERYVSAKELSQSNKVCRLLDKFVSNLSKDKQCEYERIEKEIDLLNDLSTAQAIRLTIKICKEIYL